MAFISNTTIQIRPAQESDLSALTEIYNSAITATDSTGYLTPLTREERRGWWLAHQDPSYPILVADADGETLGYASLSQWSEAPVYALTVESSLFLAPNAQGRGLGTRLMGVLLDEARRLGHHVVLSRIWSGNTPSIAMCRKCGYETVGIQREIGFRRGRWEDCVIMQVILEPTS